MRNNKGNFLPVLIMFVISTLVLVCGGDAQAQKTRASVSTAPVATQPAYSEYRGVRLGMTDKETRERLGAPALKDAELDLFVVSEKETAQITYDTARKVRSISVDYAAGVGAPDYKLVVGGELETQNGSLYKMVRYESQGFWVSYNRTVGPVIIVTITIQRNGLN
jgi:hypothetical protein